MDFKAWVGSWRQVKLHYLILLFMMGLYPLAVIPQDYRLPFAFLDTHQDYFFLPRYILLAAVSLLALALLLKKKVAINRRILVALGAFLFFAVAAAALSAYPLTAWVGAPHRYTGLSTYFFCLILFLLASHNGGEEKLLPFMTGSAAVVSLLALLQVGGLNLVPAETFRQEMVAYGTLGHPDHLGLYAAFVLPAALYLYLSRGQGRWLAAAALILAGLLVSFTWGAWLGALPGALLVCWVYRENLQPRRYLLPAVVLLAVVLLFSAGWLFYDLDKKVGLTSPAQLWRAAVNAGELLQHVWPFGLGQDHLFHVSRMLPFIGLTDKAPGMYLEMAVTMGVFALVAYLAAIILILAKMRGVLAAMVVVYLVQGLFHSEFLLLLPLFWIVLGLGLSAGSAEEAAVARPEAVLEVSAAQV